MSVMIVPLRVEEAHPDAKDALDQKTSLHLRGNKIYDQDGVLIAQLVEDREGRVCWQIVGGFGSGFVKLGESQREKTEGTLFQELFICGIGRLGL